MRVRSNTKAMGGAIDVSPYDLRVEKESVCAAPFRGPLVDYRIIFPLQTPTLIVLRLLDYGCVVFLPMTQPPILVPLLDYGLIIVL